MIPASTTKSSLVEAQTTLASAESAATNVKIARAQYEHAIAMLVGKPASEFSIAVEAKTSAPPPIPVGLPSQLLERRPDVAAAERSMAAANAQIGDCVRGLLSCADALGQRRHGEFGDQNLLAGRAGSGPWGHPLSETIYDGGLRRATVNQYIAMYNADLAAYRQSVLMRFSRWKTRWRRFASCRSRSRQQEVSTPREGTADSSRGGMNGHRSRIST